MVEVELSLLQGCLVALVLQEQAPKVSPSTPMSLFYTEDTGASPFTNFLAKIIQAPPPSRPCSYQSSSSLFSTVQLIFSFLYFCIVSKRTVK